MNELSRRNFIRNGALWIPAVPFILTARKSPARSLEFGRGQPSAPVSSCTNVAQFNDGSGVNANVASASTNKFKSVRFTASADITVCKVELILRRSGSATGNLTFYFYEHDAGANLPVLTAGAPYATSSAVYDASLLGTSASPIPLAISASLVNGTIYWLGVGKSTTSGSQFVQWEGASSGARVAISGDNATFSFSTSEKLDFNIYS